MKLKKPSGRLLVVGALASFVTLILRCPLLPFYYYHDYNVLKQAVVEAGCQTTHEYVNEDVTLEEISFDVRTPSGWEVSLHFGDDRDMVQLCERPKGLLFARSSGPSQVYRLSYLNEAVKGE